MIEIVGVRFRAAGKIYYFDPVGLPITRGEKVIVETARGIEFGTVVCDPKEIEEEKVVQPLKPVLRIATERDREQEKENKQKEREAYKVCQEKIRQHELEMKLIDAEYTFDNNKVLFYFTADGRIDFRELVKDLAAVFKTRIELRQIGVRDEAKILGGIGICGRPLCCHSYLSDFVPVSIKMAKEQNLSLNPTKISGVCGRLMCCLKNEEEIYEELNRKLPGNGDFVTTEDGLRGEVQSVNILRQLVKVLVEVDDEKEMREYPVEQLKFRKRHKKGAKVVEEDLPEELSEIVEPELLEQHKEKGNRKDISEEKEYEDAGEKSEEKKGDSGKEGNRRKNRNRDRNRGNRDKTGEHDKINDSSMFASNDKEKEREGHGNRERHGNREKRDRRDNRRSRGNHEERLTEGQREN